MLLISDFKNKLLFIIFIFVFCFIQTSFAKDDKNKTKTKTILEEKSDFTPLQILKGDTNQVNRKQKDSPNLPGKTGDYYTADQDSNYYRAMKLKISATARFSVDLKKFETNWIAEREIAAGTPMDIASRNLSIPSEIWSPLPGQQASHDYNNMMAHYVPFVNTYSPYSGLKVPLSTIGQFLGLVEDLSPNLEYKIDYATEVEVVIYSVQAVVIATIFKGQQLPGSYRFTWNFRDDKGRKMPSGDYIGEIRIGSERYVRKRIYIP